MISYSFSYRISFFIPVVLCLLSCSQVCYIGELKTSKHPLERSLKDTMSSTFFLVKKVLGRDTTTVDSLAVFPIFRWSAHYIYNDAIIEIGVVDRGQGRPSYEGSDADLSISRYTIDQDTIDFDRMVSLYSGEYPFIRDAIVVFDGKKAILSGAGQKIYINIETLTAEDDKGENIVVNYPSVPIRKK